MSTASRKALLTSRSARRAPRLARGPAPSAQVCAPPTSRALVHANAHTHNTTTTEPGTALDALRSARYIQVSNFVPTFVLQMQVEISAPMILIQLNDLTPDGLQQNTKLQEESSGENEILLLCLPSSLETRTLC